MNKDRVIDYLLGGIILMVIPQITFFSISSITLLDPKIYVIASLSGFYFICWSATIEILKRKMNLIPKVLYIILFMGIMPISAYYTFDFASPISFTTSYFGEAGFGFVFSACLAVGFELMRPKTNKK